MTMFKKLFSQLISKPRKIKREQCQDCRFVCRVDGKFRCANVNFPYSRVKNNDFCILFEPYSISKTVEDKAIQNYLERCLSNEVTSQ